MEAHLRAAVPPPEIVLPPPPADPKRIDGTWIMDQVTPLHMTHDASGHDIPMTDAANAILQARQRAVYVDHDPIVATGPQCLPPGQPWQFGLLTPFQILQTPDSVTFVFSEYHTVWSAPLGVASPAAGPRQYMGQSAGRWEGDTLVIETSTYKLPLWLEPDGMPASKDARVTMHLRRISDHGPELEIATTIDDPEMFHAPWTYVHTYAWRPDMEVFEEYDCEAQAASAAQGQALKTKEQH